MNKEFSDKEVSPEEALKWLNSKTFKNSPPYFLTHWKTGKRFFLSHDTLGAFEETSYHLVLAGEPLVIQKEKYINFYSDFLSFAQSKNKKICGYNTGLDFNFIGLKKKQLGTSIYIPISKYNFQSSKAKEVRRSLRKGTECKYRVLKITPDTPQHYKMVDDLVLRWKRSKLPFDLKYLLSLPQKTSAIKNQEEWYAVEKDNQLWAFCSLLPYKKDGEKGFYVDNLIYDPKKESHALSYLISYLIQKFKKEDIKEFNLGLTPFAELDEKNRVNRLFRLLYKNPILYKPKGLHYFKKKFAGDEKAEYYFYQAGKSNLHALYEMAKLALK